MPKKKKGTRSLPGTRHTQNLIAPTFRYSGNTYTRNQSAIAYKVYQTLIEYDFVTQMGICFPTELANLGYLIGGMIFKDKDIFPGGRKDEFEGYLKTFPYEIEVKTAPNSNPPYYTMILKLRGEEISFWDAQHNHGPAGTVKMPNRGLDPMFQIHNSIICFFGRYYTKEEVNIANLVANCIKKNELENFILPISLEKLSLLIHYIVKQDKHLLSLIQIHRPLNPMVKSNWKENNDALVPRFNVLWDNISSQFYVVDHTIPREKGSMITNFFLAQVASHNEATATRRVINSVPVAGRSRTHNHTTGRARTHNRTKDKPRTHKRKKAKTRTHTISKVTGIEWSNANYQTKRNWLNQKIFPTISWIEWDNMPESRNVKGALRYENKEDLLHAGFKPPSKPNPSSTTSGGEGGGGDEVSVHHTTAVTNTASIIDFSYTGFNVQDSSTAPSMIAVEQALSQNAADAVSIGWRTGSSMDNQSSTSSMTTSTSSARIFTAQVRASTLAEPSKRPRTNNRQANSNQATDVFTVRFGEPRLESTLHKKARGNSVEQDSNTPERNNNAETSNIITTRPA